MSDSQGHTARFEAALADRYKIERKLGEGGMASVYLAEDIKHERKVALKILRPELAAVTYTSDETGQDEVYVEPFPGLGRRFKVTANGGDSPLWAPDGSALYFLSSDLRRVEVIPGEAFDVGPEQVLFPAPYSRRAGAANYDIHPDGNLFVFVAGGGIAVTGFSGLTHVVITNALNVESRE